MKKVYKEKQVLGSFKKTVFLRSIRTEITSLSKGIIYVD